GSALLSGVSDTLSPSAPTSPSVAQGESGETVVVALSNPALCRRNTWGVLASSFPTSRTSAGVLPAGRPSTERKAPGGPDFTCTTRSSGLRVTCRSRLSSFGASATVSVLKQADEIATA